MITYTNNNKLLEYSIYCRVSFIFLQVPRVLKHEVQVEFIIVDEGNAGLSENDAETLSQSAFGIQLSARIVDTPCNEMHTDGFIEEAKKVAEAVGIKPLVIQVRLNKNSMK